MKPPIHHPSHAAAPNPLQARPAGRTFVGRSIINSMKFLFVLTMMVSAFFLFVISATAAEKTPTLPAYPNQGYINDALKQLSKAQAKVGENADEAVVYLKLAAIALEASTKDKGSYRNTAIRHTNKAIKHLEEKDKATARQEITEAIESTHKAGKAGARWR